MSEILVIDDEPQLRRVLVRVLTKMGHVVHEAANGNEGLELFRRLNPALVICDIVMAEGEGIETIREMRGEAPSMPIVAISGGSATALYLRSALALGASAALGKPFRSSELIALVTDLLKNKVSN